MLLTIPKRLRAYFLCDRRRFGLMSRVASRTWHPYVSAALGGPDCGGYPGAVPGVVCLAQSFRSLAHWHPHLHRVVTNGAFRRNCGLVPRCAHDATVLVEA